MVFGGLAWGYSILQERQYESRATILVQYRGGGSSLPYATDFSRSQQLATVYGRLLTAEPFIRRARAKGIIPSDYTPESSLIKGTALTDPPTLEISIRHRDPATAAVVAEGIAEEFVSYVSQRELSEISNRLEAAKGQGLVITDEVAANQVANVNHLEFLPPISNSGGPVVPNTRNNVLLGVVLGLLSAGLGIVVLSNLNERIRSGEQIEDDLEMTSLGPLQWWADSEVKDTGVIIHDAPNSHHAEALRQVRANIEFATIGTTRGVYLVGSAGPREGKSTIVSNAAVAFAQAGRCVVIVDTDLRRPSIHVLMGINGREPGLTNYLVDSSLSFGDVLQHSQFGVDVIPAGTVPPNPAELLGTKRMSGLISELRSAYEVVILDTPPVLAVVDASILAQEVDSVILVADTSQATVRTVASARDSIRMSGAEIIGVILNKARRSRFGYGYRYGHDRYSYGTYYTESENGNANGRGDGLLARGTRRIWSVVRRDRSRR